MPAVEKDGRIPPPPPLLLPDGGLLDDCTTPVPPPRLEEEEADDGPQLPAPPPSPMPDNPNSPTTPSESIPFCAPAALFDEARRRLGARAATALSLSLAPQSVSPEPLPPSRACFPPPGVTAPCGDDAILPHARALHSFGNFRPVFAPPPTALTLSPATMQVPQKSKVSVGVVGNQLPGAKMSPRRHL